ncbi:MAG: type II secretion system protein [Patescibacteria group bacterium]
MATMKKNGFTLVEMIVTMGIFSLLIGSLAAVFTQILQSQRKISSTQELLGQTSYVLEYMSRAIRMAKKDTGGICIPSNLNYSQTATGIKFLNYNSVCQEFYLESGQLKENKGGVVSPLTSSHLNVLSFDIVDFGWTQTDDNQPKVTLFLNIEGNNQSKIKVQTAVTQRNLDIMR